LLSVDLDKAVENALDQNVEELRRVLTEANITAVTVERTGNASTTQEKMQSRKS
jgi:preprotein translocase subunit SecD